MPIASGSPIISSTGQIGDNAIQTPDIADSQVTPAKLSNGNPGDLMTMGASAPAWQAPSSSAVKVAALLTCAGAVTVGQALMLIPTDAPNFNASPSLSRTTTTTPIQSLWDGSWLVGGGFFSTASAAGGGTTYRFNAGGSVVCDSNGAINAGDIGSLIQTNAAGATSFLIGMMKPNGTIALDQATSMSGTSTALSTAMTLTGSNIGLWASFFNGSLTDADVTSVTWNGVAMTKIASQVSAAGTSRDYLYFLAGAASGLHNLVINTTSNVAKQGAGVSYTNVGAAVGVGDNNGSVCRSSALLASANNSFVGFANASAVAAASVSVTTQGVATGLSGLTVGKQYYLSDTSGSVATTAGTTTRKVGIAISATTMQVANIW